MELSNIVNQIVNQRFWSHRNPSRWLDVTAIASGAALGITGIQDYDVGSYGHLFFTGPAAVRFCYELAANYLRSRNPIQNPLDENPEIGLPQEKKALGPAVRLAIVSLAETLVTSTTIVNDY